MRWTLKAVIFIFLMVGWCASAHAQNGSAKVLRQGLIGAGTGAAATAFSGGDGDAVWKGALVGMGVNVIGGALLDIITAPSDTGAVTYVRYQQPVVQRVIVTRPVMARRAYAPVYRRAYRAGFRDGYRQGYNDAYNDAACGMRVF